MSLNAQVQGDDCVVTELIGCSVQEKRKKVHQNVR